MSTNNGTLSGLDRLSLGGVETMSDASVTSERVSLEALAHLGEGHIAYVKQVRSEDVQGLFPQPPKIAPGHKLFALRSEERRVGKECRSRWDQEEERKKY